MVHRRLKGLRVERGLNQSDMAKRLSINPASYCHKENGKTPFSQPEVDKIISIFGKPYEEIFLAQNLNNVQDGG